MHGAPVPHPSRDLSMWSLADTVATLRAVRAGGVDVVPLPPLTSRPSASEAPSQSQVRPWVWGVLEV